MISGLALKTDVSGSSKCSKGLQVCVCVEIWREAGRNGECGEGICTNQNGNDRLRESYRESKYTHCQRLR